MSRLLKLWLLSLMLFSIRCDDLIEPDISDKAIVLKIPAEGQSTTPGSITFWWDQLDGARTYTLQVATPDLDNPLVLMADSTVSLNKVILELPVGDYQWCVTGDNFAYSTASACRTLHVID